MWFRSKEITLSCVASVLCGFGAKNEKRESMTVRKMGRVKERVGGEGRKETSIPLPTLSFFGSRFIFRADKTENPVPRPPSVIRELKNHDEVHDDDVC